MVVFTYTQNSAELSSASSPGSLGLRIGTSDFGLKFHSSEDEVADTCHLFVS